MLVKEKADLAAVEAKLVKAKEKLKYHAERPEIVRQRLVDTSRETVGIADILQRADAVDEPSELAEARRWARVITGTEKLPLEIRISNNEAEQQK